MYILFSLGEVFLCMLLSSCRLMVLLSSSVLVLSVVQREVLRSLTIIVGSSVYPVRFCLMYFTFLFLLSAHLRLPCLLDGLTLYFFNVLYILFLCYKIYFIWSQYSHSCFFWLTFVWISFSVLLLLTYIYLYIWREFFVDSIEWSWVF